MTVDQLLVMCLAPSIVSCWYYILVCYLIVSKKNWPSMWLAPSIANFRYYILITLIVFGDSRWVAIYRGVQMSPLCDRGLKVEKNTLKSPFRLYDQRNRFDIPLVFSYTYCLRWRKEWTCSKRQLTICAIVKGWTCQWSLIWHQREITREQGQIKPLVSFTLQRNLCASMRRAGTNLG